MKPYNIITVIKAWVMLRHPQLGVLVSRDGEEFLKSEIEEIEIQ